MQRLVMSVALCGTALACARQPRPAVPPPAPDEVAPALDAAPPAAPEPETVAREGSVRLDGVAELDDGVASELGPYLSATAISFADLTADGKRMLVVAQGGPGSELRVIDAPMAAPRLLVSSQQSFVRALLGPVGVAAVYSLDGAIAANYRVALSGDEPAQAIGGDRPRRDPIWTADGRLVAYAVDSGKPDHTEVWVADGQTLTGDRVVAEGSGQWSPMSWSPGGSWLVVSDRDSSGQVSLHRVQVATGKITALTPDRRASYRNAALNRAGDLLYVTSDAEGEFEELYELNVTTSKWRPLTRDIPWDVDVLSLSADGSTLAFVVNEGGVDRLRLLDTGRRRHRPAAGITGQRIDALRFASRAPVLGLTLSSAGESGDAYSYDTRTGRLVRWTDAGAGAVESSDRVAAESFEYLAADKAMIPALLYRPAGDGPHPVVVVLASEPGRQARPRYSPLIQYLAARRGIAVIEPNVRGSRGYGRTFATLDDGPLRRDAVADIGALLDWIAGNEALDQQRVAIVGESYGGYLALAAIAEYGDRVIAGVVQSGFTDLVAYVERVDAGRRGDALREYGDITVAGVRARLQAMSPLERAGQRARALLVAHGARDPRAPLAEAEKLVAAVRARGEEVWFLVAEEDGRGFADRHSREVLLVRIAMFLDRHLAVAGR